MTEEYYPYNKIIHEMEKRVDGCNIKIIDSLRYFLKESQGDYSPAQRVTLSHETIKKIDELIYKYKEKCICGDMASIVYGDHSAYTEKGSHAKKKK